MAVFPPLFLKVRSEGGCSQHGPNAGSSAHSGCQRAEWEGAQGCSVAPGWDQQVQKTTSFVMHLGE